MKKISKKLVNDLAFAILETALERYEEYFYGHVEEIAKEQNVSTEDLEQQVSDRIYDILKFKCNTINHFIGYKI